MTAVLVTRGDLANLKGDDYTPKEGDLGLVVRQTGDCFDEYVFLRSMGPGLWLRVGRRGYHGFGIKLNRLTERTFHLACAGEVVRMVLCYVSLDHMVSSSKGALWLQVLDEQTAPDDREGIVRRFLGPDFSVSGGLFHPMLEHSLYLSWKGLRCKDGTPFKSKPHITRAFNELKSVGWTLFPHTPNSHRHN
jgi:hypothetical protein